MKYAMTLYILIAVKILIHCLKKLTVWMSTSC